MEKNNLPSRIPSSGHLRSSRLRKILNIALLSLRFLSNVMIKSDLKLSAILGKFFISKSLKTRYRILLFVDIFKKGLYTISSHRKTGAKI